ncbi:MarR family transcriptional regulator [Roseibacterium beibuensis]|uniref:MarR family winged helix-turn-helix transcriptional regulator n=1 Tax=[Roseibacterium] beibuensis TaxID=1193142 RepID=UPI00217CD70A|nr:helix-turn-helix domain-containing protein [Roseibacterium beibuensis]MCS6622335.1 MarR family transcriptional regulator [Roseibacterium beibuensis]
MTDIMLETFRLNGTLLAAGDALVADLGLTSARWQVLGAVILEDRPLTVAQIARRMGLTRQSVQRVVSDLEAVQLVRFEDNPDHKRAKLVALTEAGEAAYAEADTRQIAWARDLADGMEPGALSTTVRVLQLLRARNEAREQ